MFDDPQGPIEHFSWARFVVRGKEHAGTEAGDVGAGKDIRLVDATVTAWSERHGHKLDADMVAGVYHQGIEVLVIGNGVRGQLKVTKKARAAIAEHGIPRLVVANTPEACRTYNELYRRGVRVALLAHGTC
ncbi:MAG: hypothetical protein GX557_11940 [Chloroflexi bacterium]|nr:hypothetical protein [Chloroflexota bacterium]